LPGQARSSICDGPELRHGRTHGRSEFIYKTSGCPWSKATVKSPVGARDLRPVWSFISFIFSCLLLFIWPLPCPLPCPLLCPALPLPYKTDRTAGAWVGHVIRCVILKTRNVGLLPLGDESLVSKRSWEASCMSAALKKRDSFLGNVSLLSF